MPSALVEQSRKARLCVALGREQQLSREREIALPRPRRSQARQKGPRDGFDRARTERRVAAMDKLPFRATKDDTTQTGRAGALPWVAPMVRARIAARLVPRGKRLEPGAKAASDLVREHRESGHCFNRIGGSGRDSQTPRERAALGF